MEYLHRRVITHQLRSKLSLSGNSVAAVSCKKQHMLPKLYQLQEIVLYLQTALVIRCMRQRPCRKLHQLQEEALSP